MQRWVIVFLASTCWNSATLAQSPSPEDVQFFESKVRPLLVNRCHDCHSTKAKKVKGHLLLDNRAAILKGGESGPAVVPGQPDKSLLIQAVRYLKDDVQMPPKGKLPASEIAVLEEWVRRGVPYPGAVAVVAKKDGIDWERGRKFWSFQTPQGSTPPTIRDQAWPLKRGDAFVLAEMEKRGLAPTKRADSRVLIRRATFDLIGLPPTPDEVDAFVNDKRSDAYARLIDRLLAAPAHGEHAARSWLDLARYCDIAEAWVESKGQPWLYRDWVVQAFQHDLPYNEFVQKQLAADLMPGGGPPRIVPH